MLNREDTISKINSFSSLQPNWNGHNSKPISEKVITKAIELLTTPLPDFVAPTSRNSIQFEWEVDELHLYLEIEIYEDKVEIYNHANYRDMNAYIGGN